MLYRVWMMRAEVVAPYCFSMMNGKILKQRIKQQYIKKLIISCLFIFIFYTG